jgi:4-hydroxy-tetrahydrodipicolinate synthase
MAIENVIAKIKGSLPALVTPFTKSGDLDRAAFVKLIEFQLAGGSHGLVIAGTTGESPTLNCETHLEIIKIAVETVGGRVPVIAGTGANSLEEAVELTRAAQEIGADAALVVVPYYNKPSQTGLYAHFKALHDATDIPILLYNVPGRTVADLLPETVGFLAKEPRIIGIKDATGDLERFSAHRRLCGNDFLLLSGEDGCALGAAAHGSIGCISVTANIAPALCAEFQNALSVQNFRRALELQDQLFPLHQAMFCETSPAPVKFALSVKKLCENVLRLPLVQVSKGAEEKIIAAMKSAGIV